jgi:tRNA threonylcarbamoyladenosine biosynthesis protein TsaB
MIRAVAIDTSTWWGGVALVEGEGGAGTVVAETALLVRDSHSRHLLPLLEHLLAEAGWDRSGVDLYAATRGPGSFTGLRVGLGTLKGLALAADRPCYGIGSLESIAVANGEEDRDRMAVMDAGRSEIYLARFTPGSFPPDAVLEPCLGCPESAAAAAAGPVVWIGPGAAMHREALLAGCPGSMVRAVRQGMAAGAGVLAVRGHHDGLPAGNGMSPLYLRTPEAVLKAR